MTASGILVVDKPGGMTSHDVVGRVRRILGTRKVGHAGTLDPLATGVLVVGVERATRLLGHLALRDKRYLATIRLGAATVTDDAEGDVLTVADPVVLSRVTEEHLRARLAEQAGHREQRPSSVSAVKVEGRRSYDRVRSGEDVVLPSRMVESTALDVLAVRRGPDAIDVDVDVECSTGTYVRAIARDLGDDLGVGGHLISLRRTRVGPFGVEPALDLDALQAAGPAALLGMADVAAACFEPWIVGADDAAAVRVGRRIPWSGPGTADPVAVLDETGEFLALARDDDGLARYLAVFA